MSKFTTSGDMLTQWDNLLTQHQVTCPHPIRFYNAAVAFMHPAVRRTDIEVLKEAWEAMGNSLRNLEANTEINIAQIMADHDLDPRIKSDAIATRKFMIENNLIAVIPAAKEKLVVAAITDRTTRAPATAEAEAEEVVEAAE